MDNENDLIFEAYLKENNRIATMTLAIMCAAGLGGSGCKIIDDRGTTPGDPLDKTLQWLGTVAPFFGQISPEQHRKLQIDIENVLEVKDIPEGGWEAWLKTWKKNNIG